MIKELKNQQSEGLTRDIGICVYYIKINLFSQDTYEESSFCATYGSENTLQEYNSGKEVEKPCLTQLWLRAKIITPLVEFSHQYIKFPHTPCGSYSIMQIQLRAVNTDYIFKNSKSKVNYTVKFKIHGGSEEIKIEPSCGIFKKGQVR